jgi:hypothetical protein
MFRLFAPLSRHRRRSVAVDLDPLTFAQTFALVALGRGEPTFFVVTGTAFITALDFRLPWEYCVFFGAQFADEAAG